MHPGKLVELALQLLSKGFPIFLYQNSLNFVSGIFLTRANKYQKLFGELRGI